MFEAIGRIAVIHPGAVIGANLGENSPYYRSMNGKRFVRFESGDERYPTIYGSLDGERASYIYFTTYNFPEPGGITGGSNRWADMEEQLRVVWSRQGN